MIKGILSGVLAGLAVSAMGVVLAAVVVPSPPRGVADAPLPSAPGLAELPEQMTTAPAEDAPPASMLVEGAPVDRASPPALAVMPRAQGDLPQAPMSLAETPAVAMPEMTVAASPPAETAPAVVVLPEAALVQEAPVASGVPARPAAPGAVVADAMPVATQTLTRPAEVVAPDAPESAQVGPETTPAARADAAPEAPAAPDRLALVQPSASVISAPAGDIPAPPVRAFAPGAAPDPRPAPEGLAPIAVVPIAPTVVAPVPGRAGPIPVGDVPASVPEGPPPGLPAPVLEGPAPPPDAPADVAEAEAPPSDAPADLAEATVPAPDAQPARPTPGFGNAVPGVRVNRLPTISGGAEAERTAPEQGAELLPDLVPQGDDTRPALDRYAVAFDNPEGKPLFSVIILDDDADPTARAAMARLAFPVTFAIDPMRPDARAVAEFYRDAGHEVLLLASGIPEGASPSDLEVTFASHAAAIPFAVGVLDLPEAGFQNNNLLSQQIVTILAGEGYGLVTYERGLNPADQVAQSAGLGAGRVFRVLDAGDESPATIRRYLERAAFKAAQEGRVIVMGRSRGDTIAGLMEWMMAARTEAVTLAPISAALRR